MLIYEGTKQDFIADVCNQCIDRKIYDSILEKMGRHTPKGEERAWINSLNYMHMVLVDNNIPDSTGVAIEYNIPPTGKRIDFMLSGYNKENKPNLIIVELKQWEKIDLVEDTDSLVKTFVGGGKRVVVHPSYQVWSYAKLLSDYNTIVQSDDINLYPCVFMHNYERVDNDPIDDVRYNDYISEAPVYTKGQIKNFRDFIKNFVRAGDRGAILSHIEGAKIHPSKSLQNEIASMMQGNKEFTMIDDQQAVYEQVLNLCIKSKNDNLKRTIICHGGPGTGKSVIAISLLAELTKRGQLAQYITKTSNPRQVYEAKLKGTIKKTSVKNLFKGPGCFIGADSNFLDTALVDEAHRLNEKSRYSKGENQICEIIHASKCSVFFIDESQRVTTEDIGSTEEITKWAKIEGSEIIHLELTSQFRCNGSDGYLAWLDDVLEIRQTANSYLSYKEYDFRVFDTPQEVLDLIKEKNLEANKARLVAGYCWEWPAETRNDLSYHDITIGDFGISWNLNTGKAFALREESVNEAGCIHTTQGLEFDYVGVIIGEDLRYNDNHIVTDYTKRAKGDRSIFGLKTLQKKDPSKALAWADEIIKNTYRTLMTRGMKGCYVYCTDTELRKYLRFRLSLPSD